MCDKYLLLHHKETIRKILEDADETKHFSVNINFIELSGNDSNLGNGFLREPEKSLEEWNNALKKVETNLMSQSETEFIFKNNVHCRFYSLPMFPELHRTKFPQNDDTNKFLQISGTVVRMTSMKMLEYQRQYICTKCKYVMIANAEYEMKYIIIPPKKCGNPENCQGTNIVSMNELNSEFCKDYQEVKMQETVNKLDVGCVPCSMWITLEDDLVDSCKPGDNVTVCGLVKRRSNQFIVGRKMDIDLVIKANHIQVNNNTSSSISLTPELKEMFQAFWKTYADRPLVARDIILKSISPELFGLFIVKLAMAVVLAGGTQTINNFNTGVRVRAEPHLLLVGDPGTGKSQLLRFASKIIPRSVLTTGVGSTAAGLTVTAVMENGEWQLEGGALVMSDGGICCIDEFNSMKEHDRTSIHEAMEQQTISVAKASIVCKLSTRCSILAATNPKGNIDPSQPLNMNVALPSPLLSRFDLVLLLRDKVEQDWDSQLVDYIFNSQDNCNSSKLTENINWTIETLQAYFAVIKKIHPILTDDSNKILSSYYQAQRRKNYRNKSRTTVRLLDSLVRLSQGHARLMYHENVEIVDAVTAVILVETSVEADSSVFNLHFDVKNDFPDDPVRNYRELVEVVLKKLELHDLLQKEFETMDQSRPSNIPGSTNGKSVNMSHKTESRFFHNRAEPKEERMEGDQQDKADFDKAINTSNKTTKSKNSTTLENIKLKEKENEIKNDLAALNCLPSVNNVFPVNDDNMEEDDILYFTETDNCVIEDVTTIENIDSKAKLSTDKNVENLCNEPTGTCSKETSNSGTESVDNIGIGKTPSTIGAENQSQRTKTKQYFSKFRFVSKDPQSDADTGNQVEVLNKACFENERPEDLDISFRNVHCSTQTKEKLTYKEENKNAVKNTPEIEIKHSKTAQMKKFNFKKIVIDEKNLPSNSSKIINTITLSQTSIFENQEDIDSLDLDI